MASMDTSTARKNFGELLDRVIGRERIELRRRGRLVGAVVPVEDYELLQRFHADDQDAFWGSDWREREREIDDSYAAGQYNVFDSFEEFAASLRAAADAYDAAHKQT